MENITTQTEIIRPSTPNNSWSQQKEKKAIDWKEDFEMYRYLHSKVRDYYNNMDQLLSIPSILITAITSVGIFATLGIEDNFPIIIVVGILNIATLFLQGVNKFYDPKTLANDHSNMVKEYLFLYNEIDEQLTQDAFDRENGRDFIKKIRIKSNDLITKGQPIPTKIWDGYFDALTKGQIINQMNRHLFDYLENSDVIPKVENQDNQDNLGDPTQVVIPLSVMSEKQEDREIQRSYSESSEGSKRIVDKLAKYSKDKDKGKALLKQLQFHIGRI